MGQEASSQQRKRPQRDGDEPHQRGDDAPPASRAPVILPPIAPSADHTTSPPAERHEKWQPDTSTPDIQHSVKHYPVADDPVTPFNMVAPVTTERSGATTTTTAAGGTGGAGSARVLAPLPRDATPVNPHHRPLGTAAATGGLPPIAQHHKTAVPTKGTVPRPSPAPAPPPTETKTFTQAEIDAILAIDPNRVIVTIRQNVYDVTSFVDAHPGGTSVLRRNSGKDITEAFFMMHSPRTADRLPEFLMGRLVTEAERHPPTASTEDASAASHELSLASIHQMLKADPQRIILILFGDAYDVTPMRNSHRGGQRILLNYNGKECGEIFMRVHGPRAKKEVHQYLMGRVPELGDAPSPLLRFAESVPAKAKDDKPVNPRVQSTRILEKEMLNATGTLQVFTFSCYKPLRLTAGGHVKIYSDEQRDKWSYYSPFQTEVASFKVCIKLYPNGRTSHYLFNQPEGTEVFFEGPFTPSWELRMDAYVMKAPPSDRRILLLAGGTGVAPLYSIAAHELQEQTASVTLICSVHTPDDLMLIDEINVLATRYARPLPDQPHTFRVALAFSRLPKDAPPPETPLELPTFVRSGTHVGVDFLKALALPPTQAAVLCGPSAFNDGVSSAVLQAGICAIECIHVL